MTEGIDPGGVCAVCGKDWPCATGDACRKEMERQDLAHKLEMAQRENARLNSICRNVPCPRPVGKPGEGGAQGFCSRCYSFARRHDGMLPPAKALRAPNGTGDQLCIHLPRKLRQAAKDAARAEGIGEPEWWRRAAERAIQETSAKSTTYNKHASPHTPASADS